MRNARGWSLSVVVLVLLAVGVAACSTSGDDGSSADESSAETGEAVGGSDGGSELAESESGGASGLGLPTGEPLQVGRSIIATATVRVEVDDAQEAAADATSATTAAGGFLAEQEAQPGDGTATLTLRVPTEAFDAVLGELSDLGEVESQRIDTEDVTEQVVDLESRIGSARVSVGRVRELLQGSGDVVQLATVERELAQREADLESLLGTQRVLDDQVALATIRLDLREPAAAADDGTQLPGFLGGLQGGWDGFLTTASVLVTGVGYALPFLVVAGVGGGVLLWARRRGGTAPADA